MTLANELWIHAHRGQGLSLHLDGSEPKTGYVVGLKGYGMRLDRSANNVGIVRSWTHWAAGKAKEIDPRNKPVLGVWIDGDHVYYDLGLVFFCVERRDDAIAAGRINGQLAIWDIDNACEIRLDGPCADCLGGVCDTCSTAGN